MNPSIVEVGAPKFVKVPFKVALDEATPVARFVVTDGKVCPVVKVCCVPVAVPDAFVANAWK